MTGDPFGTERLRHSVLRAWQDSPTRFTEDANAEDDLRTGGYADRLFVELAQNAADAAAAEGAAGTLRVLVGDGELRVANTGAPLEESGVAALASLRASAKRSAWTVGRFGVGFAATLTVTAEPRIVSRTGGVAFSERRTLTELEGLPELAGQLRQRGGQVPALRLVWPVTADEPPVPDGFSTEVRMPLRSDVDGERLLTEIGDRAPDLLLALPWLERVQVGSAAWASRSMGGGVLELDGPRGVQRWLRHRCSGTLRQEDLEGLGVEARERPQWSVCWAVPVNEYGTPEPVSEDVLHAPTPTDESLSVPARLIATIPVDPSRRRVRRSAAADAVLAAAARAYPELVALAAPEDRIVLTPEPRFPRSSVDEKLRELLFEELRTSSWLVAVDGEPVAPARASVLDVPVADLAVLLGEVLAGVLPAELAEARWSSRLAALGANRVGLAVVVETLTTAVRDPAWWYRLYDALTPLIEADPEAREELGALPVPLVGGTMRIGPRGALLPAFDAGELLAGTAAGQMLVHADAAHPVLERLGARRAGAADVLRSDELVAAVEHGDDPDGALTEAVLRLAELAGIRPGECPWLAAVELPDADGRPRRADELVLPAAPMLEVLAADAPVGVLAEHVLRRWPRDVLEAVGVLGGFTVLDVADPAGPQHDLAGEEQWWAWLTEPPARLIAVRDLDLVAEDRWPEALRLLADDPDAVRALHEPDGYTGWWLARHAVLAGRAPRFWRLPEATDLAGLYDPLPDTGVLLPAQLWQAIGVRSRLRVTDRDDALDVLARLADPVRDVAAPVVLAAHDALTEAVDGFAFEPADVDPPEWVRTLSGAVVAADDAAVPDGPWLLGVLADDVAVAGSAFGGSRSLAELLDLPLGSDVVPGQPTGGDWFGWAELSAARLACDLLGIGVPEGGVYLHDRLHVAGTRVPWWLDATGAAHAEDDPGALARALAWASERWAFRHILATLISEPTPRTLLT